MDMLAGQNSCFALGVVHADGSGERNHVDVGVDKKVGVIGELLGDVKFFGGGMCPAGGGVTNSGECQAIGEVRLTKVRQNASLGNTASADDTDAKNAHGCSSSLS